MVILFQYFSSVFISFPVYAYRSVVASNCHGNKIPSSSECKQQGFLKSSYAAISKAA